MHILGKEKKEVSILSIIFKNVSWNVYSVCLYHLYICCHYVCVKVFPSRFDSYTVIIFLCHICSSTEMIELQYKKK